MTIPDFTGPFPKPEPRKPKVSKKGSRNKGRRAELAVARAMNGKRMPLSGAVGGGDVVAEGWSVEVKSRAEYPALIRQAFDQAESDIATGDPRRPLVVLKADRREALYVIKESDFIRLTTKDRSENAYAIRETARAIAKLAAEIAEKAR